MAVSLLPTLARPLTRSRMVLSRQPQPAKTMIVKEVSFQVQRAAVLIPPRKLLMTRAVRDHSHLNRPSKMIVAVTRPPLQVQVSQMIPAQRKTIQAKSRTILQLLQPRVMIRARDNQAKMTVNQARTALITLHLNQVVERKTIARAPAQAVIRILERRMMTSLVHLHSHLQMTKAVMTQQEK